MEPAVRTISGVEELDVGEIDLDASLRAAESAYIKGIKSQLSGIQKPVGRDEKWWVGPQYDPVRYRSAAKELVRNFMLRYAGDLMAHPERSVAIDDKYLHLLLDDPTQPLHTSTAMIREELEAISSELITVDFKGQFNVFSIAK